MTKIKEKIVIPYKIILKRLWQESEAGRIKTRTVRSVLCNRLRLGPDNYRAISTEMKKMGYISYNGGPAGGITILVALKDLV